jgi:hypothetical protein
MGPYPLSYGPMVAFTAHWRSAGSPAASGAIVRLGEAVYGPYFQNVDELPAWLSVPMEWYAEVCLWATGYEPTAPPAGTAA